MIKQKFFFGKTGLSGCEFTYEIFEVSEPIIFKMECCRCEQGLLGHDHCVELASKFKTIISDGSASQAKMFLQNSESKMIGRITGCMQEMHDNYKMLFYCNECNARNICKLTQVEVLVMKEKTNDNKG